MARKFKHDRNKRTARLTVLWTVFIVAIVAAVLIFGQESYLQGWLLSILVAVIALYVLSIPLGISVDEHNLEIHCVVELTRIDVRDILSIRKVTTTEYKYLFPILGSYGFFGYYGYYLNLKNWNIVKVYASEWAHFVEITDIYEQTYIVSNRRADELFESVEQVKLLHTGEKTIQ